MAFGGIKSRLLHWLVSDGVVTAVHSAPSGEYASKSYALAADVTAHITHIPQSGHHTRPFQLFAWLDKTDHHGGIIQSVPGSDVVGVLKDIIRFVVLVIAFGTSPDAIVSENILVSYTSPVNK